MDDVLIANECVDFRRKSREQGVVSRLDMVKAYDTVDWDFIIWVLNKGSEPRWMDGYIKDQYFSVLINGTSKGIFKSSKENYEGDPLSPFLFSIAVDNLSVILMKAKCEHNIEGFYVGDD